MTGLPEGFDLDALLAPIPGEAPVGVDLREDFSPQSPYYRLRDARAEARAAERIADAADAELNQEAVTPPQWRTVNEIALRALAEPGCLPAWRRIGRMACCRCLTRTAW